MKLKKIRNLIFTFMICLFGSFIISNNYAEAGNYYENFTYGEMDLYYRNDVYSYMYVGGDGYNGHYTINKVYSDSITIYTNCSWSSYQGTSSGDRKVGTFNCVGYHVITATSVGNETSTTWATTFTLYTTSSSVLGDEAVYNSYIIDNTSHNYYYLRSFTESDVQNSYFEGYEEGKEDGLHDGYDLGYTEGFDDGYDLGFDDGLESNNSLVGMVGAIFTGPVTMFQQIFNFNVLGINFAEMLLGLVTLLVVIWLIKKFI